MVTKKPCRIAAAVRQGVRTRHDHRGGCDQPGSNQGRRPGKVCRRRQEARKLWHRRAIGDRRVQTPTRPDAVRRSHLSASSVGCTDFVPDRSSLLTSSPSATRPTGGVQLLRSVTHADARRRARNCTIRCGAQIPIREAGESKPESVLSARIDILAMRMIRSSLSMLEKS